MADLAILLAVHVCVRLFGLSLRDQNGMQGVGWSTVEKILMSVDRAKREGWDVAKMLADKLRRLALG